MLINMTPASLLRLDWEKIGRQHIAWAKEYGMISGGGHFGSATLQADMPYWDPAGLNVIGIRMNPITDYYTRKTGFNDFLVLVSHEALVVLEATTDPADTNENSEGDAHLSEGAYNAYIKGVHKDADRPALVQRSAPVHIVRTDSNGRITKRVWGMFGINIHNAAGLNAPSAGCQVIKPEGGTMAADDNFDLFQAMLRNAPDRDSRTYLLMSHEQLLRYAD